MGKTMHLVLPLLESNECKPPGVVPGLLKKSIFIPTYYNRVYFILHSIIIVEIPLLSVIQAIVKDWAHSTDSIPGLT